MNQNKIDALKAQGVNYEEGLHRFVDMVDLYEECLVKFADDTSLKAMQEGIEARDAQAVFRAAHSYKGLAGNLSINHIFTAVEEVVEMTRNTPSEEVDFDKVKEIVDRIEKMAIELEPVIRS